MLIAGAGAGGATFGYALAKAGRRVLFVEQGRDLSRADALRGEWAEATSQYRLAGSGGRGQVLIDCGRNPESYEDGASGKSLVPVIGFGTGGSSSLYGMVLERRYPHDFEGWPIEYTDLAPWYAQAERLYEVRGSSDPLRPKETGCEEPPEPLSAANEATFAHLRRAGLHPYRLHLACRRVPDCKLCQGYLCGSVDRCKNDARVTCLEPALRTGNARLIENARLVRFDSANRRVTGAVVQVNGEEIRLTARLYVLAAGALSTPRILLHSGLANASGLLGRRLMRHAIDLFVLTLGLRHNRPADAKELALNDHYAKPGEWLGTVQSFGMAPALESLRNRPGRNIWKMLGPAAVPIGRLFHGAPIIAGILEDRPLPENRVEVPRAESARRVHAAKGQPLDHGAYEKSKAAVQAALLGPAAISTRARRRGASKSRARTNTAAIELAWEPGARYRYGATDVHRQPVPRRFSIATCRGTKAISTRRQAARSCSRNSSTRTTSASSTCSRTWNTRTTASCRSAVTLGPAKRNDLHRRASSSTPTSASACSGGVHAALGRTARPQAQARRRGRAAPEVLDAATYIDPAARPEQPQLQLRRRLSRREHRHDAVADVRSSRTKRASGSASRARSACTSLTGDFTMSIRRQQGTRPGPHDAALSGSSCWRKQAPTIRCSCATAMR